MAIKCSLLGHAFGGTEIEEEREEQGSEVVVTIKEVEICDRCGERRVVSENKEVTSLSASDDDAPDAASDPTPESEPEPEPGPDAAETAGTGSEPAPGPDMSAVEDDAELLDAGGDESSADPGPDPDPESAPDIATAGETVDDEPTAEDDDAVILDDDKPDREPGEWPDEADEESEPDPEPAVDEPAAGGDEADAEPAAESVDGSRESTTEEWPDEYGYEEESAKAPEVDWPEEDEGDGEEWEPGESLTQRIDGDAEPAGTGTVTVPEGKFYCPECDFTTLVEESSLRAGDFCPSCRRGNLEHRAEDATRKE